MTELTTLESIFSQPWPAIICLAIAVLFSTLAMRGQPNE